MDRVLETQAAPGETDIHPKALPPVTNELAINSRFSPLRFRCPLFLPYPCLQPFPFFPTFPRNSRISLNFSPLRSFLPIGSVFVGMDTGEVLPLLQLKNATLFELV